MKTIFSFGLALWYLMGIALFAHAQEVSLDVKDKDIIEVAMLIAAQSDVQIIIGKDVAGKVPHLLLDKVTATVALEKLAAATNLVLVKSSDTSFLLKGQPHDEPKPIDIVDVNEVVEKEKLYIIEIRLTEALTQEIKVKAKDTSSSSRNWEIPSG